MTLIIQRKKKKITNIWDFVKFLENAYKTTWDFDFENNFISSSRNSKVSNENVSTVLKKEMTIEI